MEIHIKQYKDNQVSASFVHSEENKQIIAEFLSINACRRVNHVFLKALVHVVL